MQIGISLEYYTASNPSTKRLLKTSSRLHIALPLAVNVQDFVRDKCIISRFTVSTDGVQPLRIRDAELVGSNDYSAQAAMKIRRDSVLVKRDGPAAFVFKIEQRNTEAKGTSEANSKMNLRLSYRTLEEGQLFCRPSLIYHCSHFIDTCNRIETPACTAYLFHIRGERATPVSEAK
jgi:hypothetical protein